jgi:hypothetical protein
MTTELRVVRAECLKRLKRAITKSGPLTWAGARLAMWGGQYDRRDAMFYNQTLQDWIAAGELKLIELPNGDSEISR